MIEFPSHLHIEGPLKYTINSKNTYLDGVSGLIRMLTPVRVNFALRGRANLGICFPGIVPKRQLLGVT